MKDYNRCQLGMAPSKLGAYSELRATTWLMEQGYEVFRNVSPCGKTDLIAEKGGEFLRIDVKTGNWTKTGYLSGVSQARINKAEEDGVKLLIVMPDGKCIYGQDAVDKYHK